MTIALTRLLTSAEFQVMNRDAMDRGLWNTDRTVFLPGMGWLMDWIFDPADPTEHMLARQQRGGDGWMSTHYWRDWSSKRPPMTIMCPNGEEWCVDQKSNNGSGWVVTGEWPRITASPSIVVPGYHGFLRDGVFTADLEGRPPNGISRPYTPRPPKGSAA